MAMPKHSNYLGDVFGGWLMSEMDLAAAIAARRHSREGRVVTVAVDKLVFKAPVHIGDTLSCYTW
jgi:acyl-CoA thioesterase YciA